ncbi:MAG: RDD family protein [Gammaproteobacteria bacterium]|nr:RDD family protein [Gammaproteobacteria bacterium]MDE2346765.1 RDD family protein [Gammaproteobacteria bacterium]
MYDLIMFLAICMVATLLLVALDSGKDLQAFYTHHPIVKLVYQAGLLLLGYAFFGGFWIHGGQTIGMRAWGLRVARMDGGRLDWRRALIRYLCMLIPWMLLLLGAELLAAGGYAGDRAYIASSGVVLVLSAVGFLWPAFDPQRLAWHDRLSSTRLARLGKCRA